jgi:two-component system NarL family response regulator
VFDFPVREDRNNIRGGLLDSLAHSAPDSDYLPESGADLDGSGETTVMVVDDHSIVREGLVALINRHPGMRVIAEARDGRQAIDKYVEQRPDVGLLDIRMPVMDGIAAVTSILQKDASARLVVVTSYPCEEDVYGALRAGARGYLLKDSSVDELINCIRAVASGETWIPSQVGSKLAKRLTHDPLTARESQVLKAVTAGKSNKEIGNAFNISEATVKVHMTHILEKLKVTGRTEAINVALRRGLVHLEGVAAA